MVDHHEGDAASGAPGAGSGDADWMWVLADAWVGWLRPVLIILIVGLLGASYVLDWFEELTFVRLLSVGAALVLGVGPAIQAALGARVRWAGAAAIVFGLLVAAAFTAPTWRVLAPGEPLAQAELKPGETLRIDAASGGAATLVVRADQLLQPQSKKKGKKSKKNQLLEYSLSVTPEGGTKTRLEGDLSRRLIGPKGQRARMAGPNEGQLLVHGSNVHQVPVTEGAPVDVRLFRLKPAEGGPLSVAVYGWAIPWTLIHALLGALLVLAVLIDARWLSAIERNFLPHIVGAALVFGIIAQNDVGPIAPVKPYFGALLIGTGVGAVAGSVLSFVGRRVLAPRPRRQPAAQPVAREPSNGERPTMSA